MQPPARSMLRRVLTAPLRGVLLFGPMLAELWLAVVLLVALALVPLYLGLLVLPGRLLSVREEAERSRRRVSGLAGTPMASLYRLKPAGSTSWRASLPWLLGDPSTWRDLAFLIVNPSVSWAMTLLPASCIAWGLFGLVMPAVWRPIVDAHANNWYGLIHVTSAATAWASVPVGAAFVLVGFALGPVMLRAYGAFAHSLLAPSRRAVLTRQVAHLTETRSGVVDQQAEELRRLERDLHDGAQARLVAMGMTLGAAERLFEKDPDAAKALVTDAREASAKALGELQDLVRGIHPPVLADRGLAAAVRALVLDTALEVSVSEDLAERLPAPIESAVYFTVSELLANVAKHARATRVRVELHRMAGRLRVVVADDGDGGAALAKGSGLRGIERRLAAFDGTLDLDSPEGGPTVVTVEVPCGS